MATGTEPLVESTEVTPDSARTCAEFVRAIGAAYGDLPAVVLGSETLTYRELEERSRRVAQGLLVRGVGKGSRIGILFPNGAKWAVYWAAIARIGAVAIPLSTFAKPPELVRVVRHGDLHGLITQRAFLGQDFVRTLEAGLEGLVSSPPDLLLPSVPFLRWVVVDDTEVPPWARPSSWLRAPGLSVEGVLRQAESELFPEEPVTMIYTSGQSAMPKGVWHSHANVMGKTHYLRRMMLNEPGMESEATMPFFWVGGMAMCLLSVLEVGGVVRCSEAGTSSGMVIGAVGAPRPANTYGPYRAALGMSETFAMYSWGTEAPHPDRPMCPPMTVFDPEIEAKVATPEGRLVEDGAKGEMVLRGRGVTLGLQKVFRHDAFHPDGFYRTGDECLLENGVIYFLGRLGDMIKTAGANVAPAEVERELIAIDGVARAHVVGVADERLGQLVGAAIVLGDGVTLDATAISTLLRKRLSTYKVPRLIAFVTSEEIPTTPSSKIHKRELAALIAAKGIRAR